MKKRTIGLVIIGIALLIGFVVFLFNRALTNIVNETCTHGPACPMWQTIDFQTNVGIGIMVFVILVGLYFIFFDRDEVKQEEKREEPALVVQAFQKEDYDAVLGTLNGEEKQILEKVMGAQGAIFQSDLVEQTGLSKVKVTRILDRLEGRGVIERRRRGMTNVVILKKPS